MVIKKRFILPILLTIHSYNKDTGAPLSGLLFENISLGLKRRLQKISKELLDHDKQVKEDATEVLTKFKDKPEIEAEMNTLLDEDITLLSEPVSMAMIETIQTDKNYDFELIEMIAQ
jgi:HEAT repeat protein